MLACANVLPLHSAVYSARLNFSAGSSPTAHNVLMNAPAPPPRNASAKPPRLVSLLPDTLAGPAVPAGRCGLGDPVHLSAGAHGRGDPGGESRGRAGALRRAGRARRPGPAGHRRRTGGRRTGATAVRCRRVGADRTIARPAGTR